MGCDQYATDPDFVNGILQGGNSRERAVECLYRKYRRRVLVSVQTYVGYKSGQHTEIQDLVQDAFLVMVEKICFGGYNDGALVHFWIGITKGLLRNKMKRDARMDLVEDPIAFDQHDAASPEFLMISDQRRQLLESLLSRLGERCKDVLILWANGYSMREIADKLGLSSEAMARKTKYKCKSQLLEMVKGVEIDI
ncbi:MAG: sigma-70 family RNA polymerase sigma factor [Saprospiraceae bacterium]|nr:sigma-70 family RNA polymerase sigma factor [Saprospiraceae bacterium]